MLFNKKTLCAKFFVFCFVILIMIFSVNSAIAAKRISYISFNNTLNDSYGFMRVLNGQYASYVTGESGNAVRSAHGTSDGSPQWTDLTLQTSTGNNANFWTSTNELYYRYYMKFETNYSNVSKNVKLLWSSYPNTGNPQDFHNEIIQTSISSSSMTYYWQLNGGGAAWSNGKVSRYGTAYAQKGSWFLVEIYFKLSSGASNLNADGIQWLKVNGKYVISDFAVKTGKPGRTDTPGICASIEPSSGKGWWQIDEFEVWDGLPSSSTSATSSSSNSTTSSNDNTPPPPPGKPYIVN